MRGTVRTVGGFAVAILLLGAPVLLVGVERVAENLLAVDPSVYALAVAAGLGSLLAGPR